MTMALETIQPGSEQSEAEAVQFLLNNIPPEGGSVTRATLERIVRCAFRSGWIHALNPGVRPENTTSDAAGNSFSHNKAIRSTFPDPVRAVQRMFEDGDGNLLSLRCLQYKDGALDIVGAFQRDTINTLADCLAREAGRLESVNGFVTVEDLKRHAQALRDYAQTLAPAAPEVHR